MKHPRILARNLYQSFCLMVGHFLIKISCRHAPTEAKAILPMSENATQPDSQEIDLREGMHITVVSPELSSPKVLFQMAAASSAMLGDKPVHCKGLLPGVSLYVHVRQHDPQQIALLAEQLWHQVQPQLEGWIDIAEHLPCLNISIDRVNITLGLDRQIALSKGVVQFEACPTWAEQAVTTAALT